jgi:hypothetical protein
LHMENHTHGKLQHLDLPHYLGLTPTSKWVGLIPTVDFPSDPSLVSWDYHFSCSSLTIDFT